MTSSRAAATEGEANGDGERVRLRELFVITRKLTILVTVSINGFIAILDAIVVAILVVIFNFCSCVVVGAPWACKIRVAIAHLGGNGAPVKVAPRACASQRKEVEGEEEAPRTMKEE